MSKPITVIPFMPGDKKYEKLVIPVSQKTQAIIERIRDETSLVRFDDLKRIAKILEDSL